MKKFADDTKLGHSVSSDVERGELQGALDNLCKWAELWGMEFNIKKCKVMHVGFNNQRYKCTMGGEQLEVTEEEERDIGVNMTSSLKPSQQCKKAARTAQTVLSQLARAFHFRDRHVFLWLYIQNVRPHLEYAVSAWAPWYETDKECLEKVHRRAVRMISGLKATSYEEKFKELGISTLEERRKYLDMLQTYKVMTGKDNVERSTWFDMASSVIGFKAGLKKHLQGRMDHVQ
jgi:ribonuclease P/MRP protein subunit RPP40